jgi:membrane protein implicated in regulation of membrane protease activity
LYLLILATPQPGLFFVWIMGLLTLAAVVYPFSTSALVNQRGATAVVNLALGVAITSLLTGVAARAVRRVGPTPPPSRTVRQRYEYEYEPTQPIYVPPSRPPRERE